MPAKKFTFEVNRSSAADAATLFRLVSDGARWSDWAKPVIPASSWVTEGDPAPGGVGAIRKLGAGPLGVKEQTTAYEQNRLHAYALLTPGPVNNYRAEVRLTPRAEGGTDIRWTGAFEEKIPGTGKIAQKAFTGLISKIADKLVSAAEKSS